MEFFKTGGFGLDGQGEVTSFALSLALLVVGGASLIKNGGPYYGIDFKGGYGRRRAPFCGPPADRYDSQRADAAGDCQFHHRFRSAINRPIPTQKRSPDQSRGKRVKGSEGARRRQKQPS